MVFRILECERFIKEGFLFAGEVRVTAHAQTLPECCELWLLLQGSVSTGTWSFFLSFYRSEREIRQSIPMPLHNLLYINEHLEAESFLSG